MKKQKVKTVQDAAIENNAIEYTALQICNIFKFSGTDRDYVMTRYTNDTKTYLQWKLQFKKDGLSL